MSAVTGRFVSQPAVVQGHLGKLWKVVSPLITGTVDRDISSLPC